ncbi:hypothetical protein LCGC14_2728860 [marine sediment metagenome]|uniref:DUF2190 domain-containing protein n=1 Tax=marine sediment metagenome TaxID=412755 RepID=A0A0F9BZN4_9ZZZZ
MAVAVITTLLGNQGDPVEYTVDATVAVPKGTLMKISASPQTAIAASADGDFFAGIAAVEVKANTGVTKLALITHCIAEMTAGTGVTTFGQPQKISATNAVIDADDATIENSGEVVGLSLETVADGNAGAVLVNL